MNPDLLPCGLVAVRGCLKLAAVSLLVLGVAYPTSAQGPRVNNTTIRLPNQPPSIIGFTTVNALGNLVFSAPVHVATIPGDSSRL
ncbi:MAG: hypothetical protein LDL31_11705, partial [Prosthecobacter sp.]|nr:hypothetical protein [Prosthecobacter sp.]